VFLRGFLDQVFDDSGVLLGEPSIEAIRSIRLLTYAFEKINLPCANWRVEAALRQYVETDGEVRSSSYGKSTRLREEFCRMALLLVGDVAAIVDHLVYDGAVAGQHGPGATADKLEGNLKWTQREWPARLEYVFPYGDHVLPSQSGLFYSDLQDADFLQPEDERPVRVITVPKTLKGPRIIAIEPTCNQYMQQGIGREISRLLETEDLSPYGWGRNTVFGMIGFTDQLPNQEMARIGSAGGGLATIDLSEASDRVSVEHVEDLFRYFPSLLEGVLSVRSSKADVRGHGVIPLAKYASMGSALTFPLEAMVFLTAAFLGIQDAHGQPLTRKDIMSYASRVRVYGDDIIVPVDSVHHVIDRLEAMGLRVNGGKSFWTGKFRESCGGDFYDGEWVTPVRVREVLPRSRADVPELVSAVSLRNQLYFAGYWKTVAWMDKWLAEMLRHYPTVHSSSALLGRHTVLPPEGERLSVATHSPVSKGWVVSSLPPDSVVGGFGALRKCLSPGRREPFHDERHLERQGRPDAVGIKLRERSPISMGGSWLP